jgi:sodium transport system permease protein
MFRDKRVRTSAFIMPILLIAGMLYMFGSVISSLGKKENQRIHIVKSESPLVDMLRQEKIRVIEVPSAAEGERLIRKGDARIVLDIKAANTAAGQTQIVDAYYDAKEQVAQIALNVVENELLKENKKRVGEFLQSKGLPESAQELVKLNPKPIKVGDAGAGELIIGLVPYLIVIWAFYGGMGIVSDLVAGEKEKNTLETLLIAPVRRTHIVLGKFFSLAVVCLLSSLSSIVGLALYAALKPPGSEEILKGGLGLTPLSVGVTVLVLLPTVALFAAVLLAVSAYAKNTREAQTHLSVISFIVILPAIFVQFLGLTDLGKQLWINFVPVLNTGANIRAAFLGKTEWVPVFATVGTSLAIALVALKIAVWLFNREQVLTRV